MMLTFYPCSTRMFTYTCIIYNGLSFMKCRSVAMPYDMRIFGHVHAVRCVVGTSMHGTAPDFSIVRWGVTACHGLTAHRSTTALSYGRTCSLPGHKSVLSSSWYCCMLETAVLKYNSTLLQQHLPGWRAKVCSRLRLKVALYT